MIRKVKTTIITSLAVFICYSTTAQTIFINELHYDNTGADAGEGIEIAGPAGTDLSTISIILYNGSGGMPYNTIPLSGTLPNEKEGYGAAFFATSGLQNGSPDGIALVQDDEVIQFISYEGTFTATGGPATGLTSQDIGQSEASSTPLGLSLQLKGNGTSYSDFSWVEPSQNSFGSINTGQSFTPVAPVVFVNEIHYDNQGSDIDEAIELAGSAGSSLAGWSLLLYNGNNGAVYSTINLSGTFADQENGFGTLSFPITGIQNGSPDGMALVNQNQEVIQFLSYEGPFTATDGLAANLVSTDIGVVESGSTPEGFSLQLTGTGTTYDDFIWSETQPNTFGFPNTGQQFNNAPDSTDTDSLTLITIAEAKTKALGTTVMISGLLSASDQFGGPAYIQDTTAGISVFDLQIHGTGNFQIGDHLVVTGRLDAFAQMIQLVDITDIQLLSSGNEVVSDTVSIDQVTDKEGKLITFQNVTFDRGGVFYPGSNHLVTDGTNSIEIRTDPEVGQLIGNLKPTTPTTITGILSSYQGNLQLLPRFAADIPEASQYVPGGATLSQDSTLDIATWNMEFFGSTLDNYGPSDVQLQLANAVKVIEKLDADIIALQEVSEVSILDQLVDSLNGYTRICSEVYSYSFDPDDSFPPQKLCFLYRTSTVNLVDEQVLFDQFYTDARTGVSDDLNDYPTGSPQSFWASGRLPYMASFEVNIFGIESVIRLVNIHAKSGSSSSDFARKVYDIQALKDSLDRYFADDRVMVLGDYNDDLDFSISGGPSSYEILLSDLASYEPVSLPLSEQNFRSFLFADNMIDHMIITNELSPGFIDNSAQVLFPFSEVSNYANTTSDHLPVMSRFDLFALVPELILEEPLPDLSLTKGYNETTIMVTPTISGGQFPYSYSWSTGSDQPSISITPETPDSIIIFSASDATGQVVSDTFNVHINDVSCTKGIGYCVKEGVEVCNGRRTLCVPEIFVNHLLDHGYTLGACTSHEIKRVCKATSAPWKSSQYLFFDFGQATHVTIELYNGFGTLIETDEHSVPMGTSEYEVRLPYQGFFYVKVLDPASGFVQTFRMVRYR